MNKTIDYGDQDKLTVQRGKIDYVVVYDVTEDELRELERGGPASLFLNFSIFTLSIAISFLIALLTTEISSDRVFTTFLVITILGFLSGIILLILWRKSNKSTKKVYDRIRGRIQKDSELPRGFDLGVFKKILDNKIDKKGQAQSDIGGKVLLFVIAFILTGVLIYFFGKLSIGLGIAGFIVSIILFIIAGQSNDEDIAKWGIIILVFSIILIIGGLAITSFFENNEVGRTWLGGGKAILNTTSEAYDVVKG